MHEPAIKGVIAGDCIGDHPIDQLPEQDAKVIKFNALSLAVFFLAKSIEFQRIVFAGGADIIDEKIVVSDPASSLEEAIIRRC